jgi:endogenous inhibitor of DNA gyrase (YacG/DUF329 family)
VYNLPNPIRRDRRCYEHPGPRPKHTGGAQVSQSYSICPICQKSFYCCPSMRKRRTTCSRECRAVHMSRVLKEKGKRSEWVSVTCKFCGKIESKPPSDAVRPYCSRACYADARRTGINPRDPIQRRASQANGKAWRRGASRNEAITAQQWQEILDYFNQRCAYCGEEKPLDLEHITSITIGGHHVVENIVPACRLCNQRKRTRSLLVWLALGERTLRDGEAA